jgi:hypothetical protein
MEEMNSIVVAKVNNKEVTRGELSEVFDKVCSTAHWKDPWSASVHHSLVALVMTAVEFFHADKPEVIGIEPITGYVVMQGKGYQA